MGRMSEHQLFSDTEIAIRSLMHASLVRGSKGRLVSYGAVELRGEIAYLQRITNASHLLTVKIPTILQIVVIKLERLY